MMSLKPSIVYINNDKPYTRLIFALFSSHCYVHFGYNHLPNFVRVLKESYPKQFFFEATAHIFHIGN